ncbi:RcpC/CpaB family pilus assembly protein [Massilia sp. H-1]|nr:RcpC/CpaB family pilus assembly protein [Massilia sp. H-1]
MKAEIAAKGRANVVERVAVAVPTADVPVGTVVNQTNFVARKVEADLVYPDTVLAADFAALEGAKLARPVLRGRPLRLTDLVVPEVKDVSSILPAAGRRAMTIDIDNVNSIAQTLRPNNRIDLFLMTKSTGTGGGRLKRPTRNRRPCTCRT